MAVIDGDDMVHDFVFFFHYFFFSFFFFVLSSLYTTWSCCQKCFVFLSCDGARTIQMQMISMSVISKTRQDENDDETDTLLTRYWDDENF